MLTISKLAQQFGISRTTLLYYEREGLLSPSTRSANGYRWYGEQEVRRLKLILAYRSFGLSVEKIASLLDRSDEASQEQVLRSQFEALEQRVQSLRQQQAAILSLLEQPMWLEHAAMSKERWSQIMRASGMSEEDMRNWHRQFESMEPEAHQAFLESLNIEPGEIARIRSWASE